MTRFGLLLLWLLVAGTFSGRGSAAASDGTAEACCRDALRNLLLAQSAETRERFRQLRQELQKLEEEDFTWLQIAAASDQPVCSFMACNGVSDSVAKQLVALEVIEREAMEDGELKAQDQRLNLLMVLLTAVTTIIGLGGLSISYLAYRKSSAASPGGI
ncbi:MAG TPA: hypothetical protein VIB38_02280 [Aestuariivirgaceae bacterium]|jgi:hypothetical protein